MPHAAYPTEQDLVERFRGAGVEEEKIAFLQEVGVFADAVKAAVGDWESATDWKPYLKVTATNTFDPPLVASSGAMVPSNRLSLVVPLLRLNTITVGGRSIRRNEHALGPQNAAIANEPYLWLTFHAVISTTPGSIVISGDWGRVSVIPDNVWDAILQKAQTICAPDVALAITEGMTERKIGDSTKKFAGSGSDGPMDLQTRLWGNRWDRLVQSEKRVIF